MRKRAVDLSLEELAAMGANAAMRAAQQAQDVGLTVTGTVDFLEDGCVVSPLAERRPSGSVAVLGAIGAESQANSDARSGKPDARSSAD